ncbi:uncharacterized protein LOC143681628 isoform X2 [Tamandua tetradactyla]|uniref:uncharacterized protein LOC143681628 isoform X2 n=1 Tax=Tamandua tetradactyla TaxID=48850 RepID=UPI004054055E
MGSEKIDTHFRTPTIHSPVERAQSPGRPKTGHGRSEPGLRTRRTQARRWSPSLLRGTDSSPTSLASRPLKLRTRMRAIPACRCFRKVGEVFGQFQFSRLQFSKSAQGPRIKRGSQAWQIMRHPGKRPE